MLVNSIFTSLSTHSISPITWKEPLAGRDHLSSSPADRETVDESMHELSQVREAEGLPVLSDPEKNKTKIDLLGSWQCCHIKSFICLNNT